MIDKKVSLDLARVARNVLPCEQSPPCASGPLSLLVTDNRVGKDSELTAQQSAEV
jgi:hypothetical protein